MIFLMLFQHLKIILKTIFLLSKLETLHFIISIFCFKLIYLHSKIFKFNSLPFKY